MSFHYSPVIDTGGFRFVLGKVVSGWPSTSSDEGKGMRREKFLDRLNSAANSSEFDFRDP